MSDFNFEVWLSLLVDKLHKKSSDDMLYAAKLRYSTKEQLIVITKLYKSEIRSMGYLETFSRERMKMVKKANEIKLAIINLLKNNPQYSDDFLMEHLFKND